jgi:hypothetical protein
MNETTASCGCRFSSGPSWQRISECAQHNPDIADDPAGRVRAMEFLKAVPVGDDRWAAQLSRDGIWHTFPQDALDTMARVLSASAGDYREEILNIWCDGLEDVAADMPGWWRPDHTRVWRAVDPAGYTYHDVPPAPGFNGVDYITADIRSGEEVSELAVATRDGSDCRRVEFLSTHNGTEEGSITFEFPQGTDTRSAPVLVDVKLRGLAIEDVTTRLSHDVAATTLHEEAQALLAFSRCMVRLDDYHDGSVLREFRDRVAVVDGSFHKTSTNDHVMAVYQSAGILDEHEGDFSL